MKIFSIYDAAVETYLNPFFAKTMGSAIRSFSDGVNDETTMFNKHANDYTLYQIGEFDEDSGAVVGHPPKKLITGPEVLVSTGEIE